MSGQDVTSKLGRCPECTKPAQLEYRPFCSKRCADIDLGRWIKGQYAIPVVEEDRSAVADEDLELPFEKKHS
jgi:endogenous inhibitor of DNA gyrase (YacG/DUF329 family)